MNIKERILLTIFLNFFIIITIFSCSKKVQTDITPLIQKEIMLNISGKDSTFAQILTKYDDKSIILIDIWASWCPDCIKGLDELKQIQSIYANKNIIYLMLSVDDNEQKWLKAINKFSIIGEHFRIKNGWKTSEFCNFLGVNWIPRYILINNKGKILHFDAIEAGDKNLVSAIEKNIQK